MEKVQKEFASNYVANFWLEIKMKFMVITFSRDLGFDWLRRNGPNERRKLSLAWPGNWPFGPSVGPH